MSIASKCSNARSSKTTKSIRARTTPTRYRQYRSDAYACGRRDRHPHDFTVHGDCNETNPDNAALNGGDFPDRFRGKRHTPRNGIDYFIDRLTAFHEPMEAIVLAAKDKTGDTLTDADIALIRKRMPQAEQAWQRVAAAKLDASDYRLTPAQADDARELMTFGDFKPYST